MKSNLKYHWDESLCLQENADKNRITYGTMSAFKRRFRLRCAKYKKRRLKTLFKREIVNYLYDRGFGYEDIGRLFKHDASVIWNIRQNGINEISIPAKPL